MMDGYRDRDEWLDDLHAEYLSRLTTRQRLARWWRIRWPAVVALVILVGAVVGLLLIERKA